LKIAQTSPMHGFLTSIRATIQLENLDTSFYQNLMNVLEESVELMLEILSGGNQIKNASFADMGIAVEAITASKEASVSISDDHR